MDSSWDGILPSVDSEAMNKIGDLGEKKIDELLGVIDVIIEFQLSHSLNPVDDPLIEDETFCIVKESSDLIDLIEK